ncbi:hypothetical protein A0H81_02462 [Grifola frondosa]|uniref:Ubiquitin-like domain-containing protein n=1 Tax=Grifola frondosa TaxID=5627 RepID=A0A1C7MN78_GRIFR|nr:hypothetical protein A0H81_02462 [Grifola frondosa]
MGYTQDNAIELLDVLGRKLVLPMELCFTWEQFDATLKVYFTNRAGQRFVDRGQYEVSRRGEKDVIDPSGGRTLSASDRMRGNEVRQCPRCHHDNTALAVDAGEWVECRYCGGRYQISEVEQQEVEDSSGDHPAAMENGPGDDHTLEIQDMRLFRSIHVLTSKDVGCTTHQSHYARTPSKRNSSSQTTSTIERPSQDPKFSQRDPPNMDVPHVISSSNGGHMLGQLAYTFFFSS